MQPNPTKRAAPRPRIPRTCPGCGAVFFVKVSMTTKGHRMFCSGACRRAEYGTMPERFWAKVDKAGPVPSHAPELGPCWHWTGARCGPMHYGIINSRVEGRIYAHRFSYLLSYGAIPDGLLVLHRCDVPWCVNPAHLFLGTQVDNMRDMHAKGRDRNGIRPSRLTAAQVHDSRRRYAAGEATRKQLAAEYGVCKTTMRAVLLRETWSHID